MSNHQSHNSHTRAESPARSGREASPARSGREASPAPSGRKGSTDSRGSSAQATDKSKKTTDVTRSPLRDITHLNKTPGKATTESSKTKESTQAISKNPKQEAASTKRGNSLRTGASPHLTFKAKLKFKNPEQVAHLAKERSRSLVKHLKAIHDGTRKSGLKRVRMPNSTSGHDSAELLRKIIPVNVTGKMMVTIDVIIGTTTKSTHTLPVDTGSGVTWLPANKYLLEGRSVSKMNKPEDEMKPLLYKLVSNEGMDNSLYKDTFQIGDTTVENQLFAVVTEVPASIPTAQDGIFALGPQKLTAGMYKNKDRATRTIPTLVDNMVSQGKIDAHVVVLDFSMWNNDPSSLSFSGRIYFGGADQSIMQGAKYVKESTDFPSEDHNAVDVTLSLTSAGHAKELAKNKVVVFDTGTPGISFAPAIYNKYIEDIGARPFMEGSEMMVFNKADFHKLKTLRFSFSNGNDEPVNFDLTPSAQIFPPNFFKAMGEDLLFLIAGKTPITPEEDKYMPSVILGASFLQRCTLIIDESKKATEGVKIGIKKNAYTDAEWEGLA